MRQLVFDFVKEEDLRQGKVCASCSAYKKGICQELQDKVMDNDSCDSFDANKNQVLDEQMNELFANNQNRLDEILSFYRIPKITKDEIKLLCKWS